MQRLNGLRGGEAVHVPSRSLSRLLIHPSALLISTVPVAEQSDYCADPPPRMKPCLSLSFSLPLHSLVPLSVRVETAERTDLHAGRVAVFKSQRITNAANRTDAVGCTCGRHLKPRGFSNRLTEMPRCESCITEAV